MKDNAASQAPKNKTDKKPTPWLGLIIIGVIVVAVAAVLMSSGSSPKKSKGSAGNTPSSTPSLATQVKAWEGQYGDAFTILGDDMGKIGTDSSNPSAMIVDCKRLTTDVETAQSYPAIPDTSIEQHWSTALADMNSGGNHCAQGINNTDTNQLQQASSEFTNGTSEINTIKGAMQLAAQNG